MTKFETNDEMELLIKLRNEQPTVFAGLSPPTKMQVGIYQNNKAAATGTNKPTQETLARIGELKQFLTSDISPAERISASIEISELEKK